VYNIVLEDASTLKIQGTLLNSASVKLAPFNLKEGAAMLILLQ
jgi:hypothetical protein